MGLCSGTLHEVQVCLLQPPMRALLPWYLYQLITGSATLVPRAPKPHTVLTNNPGKVSRCGGVNVL